MDNGLELLKGRMSGRLVTVADMLGGGAGKAPGRLAPGSMTDMTGVAAESGYTCTADVGCDHGYISMYLVMKGISDKAIAMDLRNGPLSAAKSNIAEFGIADKVSIRLSDGLDKLEKGEADSLVVAGMGGKLMISILEKKDIPSLGIKRGVLQPQSDIPEFRGYLRGRGFSILDERIVLEDGKYYFPMLVDFTGADEAYDRAVNKLSDEIAGSDLTRRNVNEFLDKARVSVDCSSLVARLADEYGIYNILRREPLLRSYLEHGLEVNNSILGSLDKGQHPDRYREVASKLSDIELLLDLF